MKFQKGIYGDGFHSAYVRDPDGNKLAFVYYASAD